MTITTTTRVVGSTDGHRVEFQGLGVRHVLDGGQTAGAFALVEHDLAPRALGSPMHAHEREDEISHVLAGRLGVQVGDEVIEAGPGDTVVKPRGVAHAFWNPGGRACTLCRAHHPGRVRGLLRRRRADPVRARRPRLRRPGRRRRPLRADHRPRLDRPPHRPARPRGPPV